MTPDIRFFQAAATVIPTLLVAVAVTAKTFDAGAYPDEASVRNHAKTSAEKSPAAVKRTLELAERAWWTRTSFLVLVFVVLAVATIVAERAALAALVENEPTSERMHQVYFGIAAQLALLILSAGTVLSSPITRHATKPYQAYLARILLLAPVLGLAVALGMAV